MTDIDTRPAGLTVSCEDTAPAGNPPVIDGVASPRDIPANPHRLAVWASTLILAGAAAGAFTQVNGGDLERGGAVFALLAALAIWVTCQIRFHGRAEAGDR